MFFQELVAADALVDPGAGHQRGAARPVPVDEKLHAWCSATGRDFRLVAEDVAVQRAARLLALPDERRRTAQRLQYGQRVVAGVDLKVMARLDVLALVRLFALTLVPQALQPADPLA
jgi:hypothetical protein